MILQTRIVVSGGPPTAAGAPPYALRATTVGTSAEESYSTVVTVTAKLAGRLAARC